MLRILLYQDRQQLPIQALLEKALGDNAAMLRSERTGMDVMVLTPGAGLSGSDAGRSLPARQLHG